MSLEVGFAVSKDSNHFQGILCLLFVTQDLSLDFSSSLHAFTPPSWTLTFWNYKPN